MKKIVKHTIKRIGNKKNASHTSKLNILRAAVLGANDGIISISGLLAGIVAASTDRRVVLFTGIAGTVAAAISMAAGEYVSVATQRDAEKVKATADSKHNSNDSEPEFVNPWDAAIASSLAFTAGAAIPILSILLTKQSVWIYALYISVPVALAINGYLSSKFSGGKTTKAIIRTVLGGLVAMSVTYFVGSLFGVNI